MKYKTIISDDVISLLWYCYENDNINDFRSANLRIVLNEGKKSIGTISYNLGDSKINNVTYRIFDDYQNKGYATRALSLLKDLIKNNSFKGDKNLYLTPTNSFSERVILKNDGELIHIFSPTGEIYYTDDDIVKIYKITIK